MITKWISDNLISDKIGIYQRDVSFVAQYIFITENIFVGALDLILHVQYFIASTIGFTNSHFKDLFAIVKQSSIVRD